MISGLGRRRPRVARQRVDRDAWAAHDSAARPAQTSRGRHRREPRMSIATIETGLYRIQLPVPLSDSTHGTMTHFELVTVRLRDSDGAEGVGYTYTTGAGGAAVRALIDRGLRGVLQGADPDQIEALWHK